MTEAAVPYFIKNPRMPRPYGSDRGDYGFEDMGVMAVDRYMALNMRAANDNKKLQPPRL